jgi:signal transduction histidine kinase
VATTTRTTRAVSRSAHLRPRRVAAVRATGLLDRPSPLLDHLCAAAADALAADTAMVTLLDDARGWIAGEHGLAEPWATTREIEIPASLCQYIPAPDRPLAVGDLARTSVLADSWATGLGFRSYLAYQIRGADGLLLGALCAARERRSTWTAQQRAALAALASLCERYIRHGLLVRHDPSQEIAMVAHDMRNPLTVLRGVANMLPAATDDVARDQLAGMVDRATTAVDALVDDLVTAGAPSTEGIPTRREHFDLVDLINETVGPTTSPEDTIIADLPDQAMVYADPRAVTRIVRNLLDNARRHGAPPVSVALRRTDAAVVIDVMDHGPGIPIHEQPHLFTRFRPGTARSSGSGLGLHIVQRLAAAHRGTVELVEPPDPAHVTCFRVVLPQRSQV